MFSSALRLRPTPNCALLRSVFLSSSPRLVCFSSPSRFTIGALQAAPEAVPRRTSSPPLSLISRHSLELRGNLLINMLPSLILVASPPLPSPRLVPMATTCFSKYGCYDAIRCLCFVVIAPHRAHSRCVALQSLSDPRSGVLFSSPFFPIPY